MTEFETEMSEVLIELLDEFGWAGTLKHPTGSEIDEETLVSTPSYDDNQIKAVFFDPTSSNLVGYEQDLESDQVKSLKWMIVQSADAEVETGDLIVSPDHGTFKVGKATAIGPSNPIYYKTSTTQVA